MAKDRELKSLERLAESLETEGRRRSERRQSLFTHAIRTFYVVTITTLIVLSVIGTIHHH